MNTLPQNYSTTVGMHGTVPAQPSLNEKLVTLAGHARNMSQTAFEIGMRLGALQPVNSSAGAIPKEAAQTATSAINDLDAALTQLNEDLNRIRAFVG